jgi:hypothetical protein
VCIHAFNGNRVDSKVYIHALSLLANSLLSSLKKERQLASKKIEIKFVKKNMKKNSSRFECLKNGIYVTFGGIRVS